MVGRADGLLAIIALPFLLAAALVPVTAVPVSSLFGAAAIPATGGLGYALFGAPPN
ncbi:MAG: hypothetical protein ABEH64_11865 [Salinirussus sp.]